MRYIILILVIPFFGFLGIQNKGSLDFENVETHLIGSKQVVDIRYEICPQLIMDDHTYSELSRIAKFHSNFPDYYLEIAVHTDSRGTAEMNTKLSQKRAEFVIFEMERKFPIDKEKFIPVGYGESQPIISDSIIYLTESKEKKENFHQLNRRTEIVLVGK